MTTIKSFPKTIHQYSSEDVNTKSPFTIFVINLGVALHTFGPRAIDDEDHASVYEILSVLEDKARCSFDGRCFEEFEVVNLGNNLCAVFTFKELRKLEGDIYAAYYEFDSVARNDKKYV